MFLSLFSCFRRIKSTYYKERVRLNSKTEYHKTQNIYYNIKTYTTYKITNIIPKDHDTWYYMVDSLSEVSEMNINFNLAYRHYGYLSITNLGIGLILLNFHQRIQLINHEELVNKVSLFQYYRHSLEEVIETIMNNFGTFGYEYIPHYRENTEKIKSTFIYRKHSIEKTYKEIDKKLSENPFNLFLQKFKNKLKRSPVKSLLKKLQTEKTRMENNIIASIIPVLETVNEDIKKRIKQDITIKYLQETYSFEMGDHYRYEIVVGFNFYMSFIHKDIMLIFRVFITRINKRYDVYLILYIIIKDKSVVYKLIMKTISLIIGRDLPSKLKHIENVTILDYTEIPRDNSDFKKIISDVLNNQEKFSLV